jgi:hypothetical protein
LENIVCRQQRVARVIQSKPLSHRLGSVDAEQNKRTRHNARNGVDDAKQVRCRAADQNDATSLPARHRVKHLDRRRPVWPVGQLSCIDQESTDSVAPGTPNIGGVRRQPEEHIVCVSHAGWRA